MKPMIFSVCPKQALVFQQNIMVAQDVPHEVSEAPMLRKNGARVGDSPCAVPVLLTNHLQVPGPMEIICFTSQLSAGHRNL